MKEKASGIVTHLRASILTLLHSAALCVTPVVAVILVGLALALAPPTLQAKVRPYSKSRTLQNRLHITLIERSEQPLISFRILIRAGSKYDPPDKSGLASLTAGLLRQGAGKRDADMFQRFIDSLGVRLHIGVTRDVVDISATVLRKQLFAGTRLIRDLLMEQRFDSVSFARQKQRSVSAILQATDAGYATVSDFAYSRFFSSDSYGKAPQGELQDVQSITLDDVRDFYKRFYAPERISIIAAGEIEAKDYLTELHETLTPYHKNKHPEQDSEITVTPPDSDSLEIYLLNTPGAEGARVGFFALCDSAADFHPFSAELMLSHLLAGFPELSFLGRRLVEDDNLVSQLHAELPFSPEPTLLAIQMDCTGDKVVDAVQETIETLSMLKETRISKREIEEGKNYFNGFYALGFETAHDVTARLAKLLSANLPLKAHDTLLTELNLLRQSDLQETAKTIFAPSHLIVVISGDTTAFAEAVRNLEAVRVIPVGESSR